MNDIFQFEVLGEGPRRAAVRQLQGQPGAAVVPARGCRISAWTAPGGRRWRKPKTGQSDQCLACMWSAVLLPAHRPGPTAGAAAGLERTAAEPAPAARCSAGHGRDAAHAHPAASSCPRSPSRQRAKDQSIGGMAARIFGFDPARPDRYPLQWWIVVPSPGALATVAHIAGVRHDRLPGWLALPVAWVCAQPHVLRLVRKQVSEDVAAPVPRRAGDDRALGARRRAGQRSDPQRGARGASSRPARSSAGLRRSDPVGVVDWITR